MHTPESSQIVQILEQMRANGEFDGFMEENMDFSAQDREDLEWYYVEWIKPSLDED